MENLRWTDRLAKYTVYAAVTVIVCAILWYFRNVVVYILIAGVLSLICKPLSDWIRRWNIKGHYIPDWAASLSCLVVIFAVFAAVVILLVPIVGHLASQISTMNVSESVKSIAVPLREFNNFLIKTFPNLGEDFRIEMFVTEELQKLFNVSLFSSVITSVTSFIVNTGVALFSIVFISFFFFKDQHQFTKIVAALVPDKSEKAALATIDDVQTLLTRYLLGLVIEVFGVTVVNFIGLIAVTGLGFNVSISIAVIVGLTNIVPYVGPIIGGAIGIVIGVLVKFSGPAAIGLNVGFWPFVLILLAIFVVTQLIDNYLFKMVIYANSVNVPPLEIFIVFLMAGQIGGIVGMLIAIPAYTVLRVIAGRFLVNVKFVRRLVSNPEEAKRDVEEIKREEEEIRREREETERKKNVSKK